MFVSHCRGSLERFALYGQPDFLWQANFWELQTCVPAGLLPNSEAKGVAFPTDAVDLMECQLSDVQHEELLRSPDFAQSKAEILSSGASICPLSLTGSMLSIRFALHVFSDPLSVCVCLRNTFLPGVSGTFTLEAAAPMPSPPSLLC